MGKRDDHSLVAIGTECQRMDTLLTKVPHFRMPTGYRIDHGGPRRTSTETYRQYELFCSAFALSRRSPCLAFQYLIGASDFDGDAFFEACRCIQSDFRGLPGQFNVALGLLLPFERICWHGACKEFRCYATPSQGNSSNTRHRCRTCPLRQSWKSRNT
jgi:hypothetical protein